jgi:uncharacterized membrane protein
MGKRSNDGAAPFPGGYNSYATAANNRGQVVGWAENGTVDPTCDTDFQILQFRAVIWGPHGEMQELPPLPGDSTSAATAINDQGQVVGSRAHVHRRWRCQCPALCTLGRWRPHQHRRPGRTTWNTPTAINNHGTVVGFSLPQPRKGRGNYEAFIWTL